MREIWSRHHFWLFVFAFALTVRIIALQFIPPPALKWLPYQFDLRASQLLAGETIAFPDAWASFHIVLAGFYAVFEWLEALEHRVLLWAYVQSVMAAIAAAILYDLTRKLCGSNRIALAAGVLFSLHYPFLYLNTLVLSETTFVLVLVAAFHVLLTWQPSVKSLALAGVLLGIALICRPILTPFFPLLGIWLLVTMERGKRIKYLAILGLGVAAVMTIASSINADTGRHHRFSYSGNTGANVALAQCRLKTLRYDLPSGEYFWFSPPSSWGGSLPTVKTDVPFYEDSYYLRMGLNCVLEEPSRLVGNFAHLARLYHSVLYPDFADNRHHRTLVDVWKFPAVILTLAFIAAPLVRRECLTSKAYWLFAALFVSLFVSTYVANPGEERHFVPYFWVLLPYGLPALLQFLHEHPASASDGSRQEPTTV